MQGRRICFVSSEVAPFAKTGGLADVSGALPKYLARHGCEVRIFMPFYDTIDISRYEFHLVEYLHDLTMQFGGETIHYRVLTARLPDSEVDVYFIDCPQFYSRGSVYTDDADEYRRFVLLSRAAIECCQWMGWGPDIFHCNDWQTALVPLYLRTVYSWDRLFQSTRTLLTIHNIAYQGIFSADIIGEIGLGESAPMFSVEDRHAGIVNFMKTGIFYADVITTVSRTYAREIQTPEYGAGLQEFLQRRSNALVGIVNGVDYNEWSPENDALIPHRYSMEDMAGKEANKRALLESMGLGYHPAVPVLGIVSRLTAQKGFDLFFDIMDDIIGEHDLRLVVLGSGEGRYEEFFTRLQHRYPAKVAFYSGFQNKLAHMIEAGSDIFLMPSQFEPCGLNQIYSLRYGTVPVVRKTGGLNDTVEQYDAASGNGTGFVFEHFTAAGLRWGIETAITTFYDRAAWHRLMRNAMSRNFSWDVQVRQYLELYERM